jgi:hypothetical protein
MLPWRARLDLKRLLEAARSASPDRRIEWRDRIAAQGTPAIANVSAWLGDPVLAAFAVRVIERIGALGDAEVATEALRAARPRVPPAARGDVDWALQRLRFISPGPGPSVARPAAGAIHSPARVSAPRR